MRGEVHHLGLTVGELERSVAFYTGHLGLRSIFEVRLEGEAISEQTGLPGTVIDIAVLAGASTMVELLCYAAPERRTEPPRPCDVGAAHACLVVDDLDTCLERLRAAGVVLHARPCSLLGDETRMVYVRDPDGIMVELLQPSAAAGLRAPPAAP